MIGRIDPAQIRRMRKAFEAVRARMLEADAVALDAVNESAVSLQANAAVMLAAADRLRERWGEATARDLRERIGINAESFRNDSKMIVEPWEYQSPPYAPRGIGPTLSGEPMPPVTINITVGQVSNDRYPNGRTVNVRDTQARWQWRRRILASIDSGAHRARDCASCGASRTFHALCPGCRLPRALGISEPLIAQPGAVYRWRERIRARSLAAVTLPLDAPPGGLCASWEQSIRWQRSTRCDDRVMRCPSRKHGLQPACVAL